MQRIISEQFDEHLTFNLPEGYEVERDTDDSGNKVFKVKCGVSIDEDGNKSVEQTFQVFGEDSEIEGNVKSNLDVYVKGSLQQVQHGFLTLPVLVTYASIRNSKRAYRIVSITIVFLDAEEKAMNLASHLTRVINSAVIDGVNVNVEDIPMALIYREEDEDIEEDATISAFPVADPTEDQHTHWNFLNGTKNALGLFGAFHVNENGTEYELIPVSELNLNDSAKSVLDKYPNTEFELAEIAHKMSNLFRVNYAAFDANHDREQEIERGYISRVYYYEVFRSFAWTITAYCADHRTTPADIDYDTLNSMCWYIRKRGGLNYKGSDYSPAICSGDDIHIYYLRGDITPEDQRKLIESLKDDSDDKDPAIVSLDDLRSELSFLYPAIKSIYEQLSENRDRDKVLEEGTADILYTWCSITYAARRPFFSEDGPMNCFYEHPDEKDDPKRLYERLCVLHNDVFELAGTQYEGRTDRIERVQVGDRVFLVREPDNEHDPNTVDIRNKEGSLGHVPAFIAEDIAAFLNRAGDNALIGRVIEVVPLSKRSSRAKKSIVKVQLELSEEVKKPGVNDDNKGSQSDVKMAYSKRDGKSNSIEQESIDSVESIESLISWAKNTKAEYDASWENSIKQYEERLSSTTYDNLKAVRTDIKTISKDINNFGGQYERLLNTASDRAKLLIADDSSEERIESVYKLLGSLWKRLDGWTVRFELGGKAKNEKFDAVKYSIKKEAKNNLNWWEEKYYSCSGKAQKEIEKRLNKEVKALNKLIDEKNGIISDNKRQLGRINGQIKESEQRIQAETIHEVELKAEIDRSLSVQSETFYASRRKEEEALVKLNEKIISIENEIASLSIFGFKRKRELRSMLQELQEQLEKHNELIRNIEKEIQSASQEASKQKKAIEQATSSVIESTEERLANRRKEAEELSKKNQEEEAEVLELQDRLKQVESRINNLDKENTEDIVKEILSDSDSRFTAIVRSGRRDTISGEIATKLVASQMDNEAIKGMIKDVLSDATHGMTAIEVSKKCDITLAKATFLITQLVKSGDVIREVENKIARFYPA